MRLPLLLQRKLKKQLETLAEQYVYEIKNGISSPIDRGYISLFLFLVGNIAKRRDFLDYAWRLRDFAGMSLETDYPRSLGIFNHPASDLSALDTWKILTTTKDPTNFSVVFKTISEEFKHLSKGKYFFELIHGAVGIGTLARMYGQRSLENAATRYLREHIRTFGDFKGYVSDVKKGDSSERTSFNLGVSHGLIGPLFFALYEKNSKIVEPLIETLRAATEDYPNLLPTHWSPKKLNFKKRTYQSGWCYGDPMAGFALLQYANYYSEKPNSEWAFSKGLDLVSRSLNQDRLFKMNMDLHFCHGLSGLAQIGIRSFQLTRERNIELLVQEICKVGTLPVSRWISTKNLRLLKNSSKLLMGHLGTGLMFAHLLHDPKVPWDKQFLLSPPGSTNA